MLVKVIEKTYVQLCYSLKPFSFGSKFSHVLTTPSRPEECNLCFVVWFTVHTDFIGAKINVSFFCFLRCGASLTVINLKVNDIQLIETSYYWLFTLSDKISKNQ